jgi:hypothetical protein
MVAVALLLKALVNESTRQNFNAGNEVEKREKLEGGTRADQKRLSTSKFT